MSGRYTYSNSVAERQRLVFVRLDGRIMLLVDEHDVIRFGPERQGWVTPGTACVPIRTSPGANPMVRVADAG